MRFDLVLIGLLLLMASAAASCTSISFSDEFVEVVQFSTANTAVILSNGCNTAKNYSMSVQSSFGVVMEQSVFLNAGSSKALTLTLSPGGAEPALYEIVVSTSDASRSFAVKVLPGTGSIIIDAPFLVRSLEGSEIEVVVGITNDGSSSLINVGVVLDEENQRPILSDELLTINPHQQVFTTFVLPARSLGTYDLNVTVFSGDMLVRRPLTIEVSDEGYPILSVTRIQTTENGYIVNYLAKNVGQRTVRNLFLTVDDAPSDWEVLSPPVFSLLPGSSRELELVLNYGESTDGTITLALYEGQALLNENELDFNKARLSGTGLITFGDSFMLGAIILVFMFFFYLAYRKRRDDTPEGSEHFSISKFLSSLWPFGH